MFSYIKQLAEKLNNTKTYLILTNIFLVFFLILFNNLGLLPMRMGDFIFFAILILAFALYRPSWAFLFFVGTIMLENINLAPEKIGIMLRPYQLIGGLLFLAIAIRFFSKRLNFKLTKLRWWDYLVFLIPLSSLMNVFSSQNPTAVIRLVVVLGSFVILYLLVRNYIQHTADLKKILPFFFGSSLIVVLYGFWQNIRFAKGLGAFSVMPGRPNGTLTEPDWLGLFLLLVLAGIYALIYFFHQNSLEKEKTQRQINLFSSYLLLCLTLALLLISVSRSAWLGAALMTILFLFSILTGLKFNFRAWQWKLTVQIKLGIIGAFIIALGAVYLFQLTTFKLFDRAVSTGGTQKITISCQENITLPEKISSLEGLDKLNCLHINLEEIDSEKNQGRFVMEINRPDPNVNVRAEVYQKSFAQIKAHPILGIGWANIPEVLGKDPRGVNLNSSNIFLETYLGSGLIGFLSLLLILGTIFIRAVSLFFKETDPEKKAFALFVIASWTGIIIFNLFNAGIMLGFFWVWLGIAGVLVTKR